MSAQINLRGLRRLILVDIVRKWVSTKLSDKVKITQKYKMNPVDHTPCSETLYSEFVLSLEAGVFDII